MSGASLMKAVNALRESGQRTTAEGGRHAIRRALVAAELALAAGGSAPPRGA